MSRLTYRRETRYVTSDFEPLICSVLFEEDRWDAERAVASICGGQVGVVVIDSHLGDVGGNYGQFGAWPGPVLSALHTMLRLESNQANRSVYVPRADGAS